MPENIAIIPARAGSVRVPRKNIRELAGHPLIAYSIQAAIDSEICDRIIISTDSEEIGQIALSYGAEVLGLRPEEFASNSSHDIDYLRHAIQHWVPGSDDQLWTILRPTSPLRSGASIRNARECLLKNSWADSIRSLKRVTEHPGKMWRVGELGEATTYLNQGGAYNGPTQELETIFVQASSLEIVKRGSIRESDSIAGKRVLAFMLPETESFDINSESDWEFLEYAVQTGRAHLPLIGKQR